MTFETFPTLTLSSLADGAIIEHVSIIKSASNTLFISILNTLITIFWCKVKAYFITKQVHNGSLVKIFSYNIITAYYPYL